MRRWARQRDSAVVERDTPPDAPHVVSRSDSIDPHLEDEVRRRRQPVDRARALVRLEPRALGPLAEERAAHRRVRDVVHAARLRRPRTYHTVHTERSTGMWRRTHTHTRALDWRTRHGNARACSGASSDAMLFGGMRDDCSSCPFIASAIRSSGAPPPPPPPPAAGGMLPPVLKSATPPCTSDARTKTRVVLLLSTLSRPPPPRLARRSPVMVPLLCPSAPPPPPAPSSPPPLASAAAVWWWWWWCALSGQLLASRSSTESSI